MPKKNHPVTSFCMAVTIPALLLLAPAALAQPNYRLGDATAIESAALPPISAGLMTPSAAGLRETLWQGLDQTTWDVLLNELPPSLTSNTLRNLLGNALLANAPLPFAATPEDNANLSQQDARAAALLPFIKPAEFSRYLATLPKASRTATQDLYLTDLQLAEGEQALCKADAATPNETDSATTTAPRTTHDAYIKIYCILADSNNPNRWAEAQLQLDLLGDRSGQDSGLGALFSALIAKNTFDANTALPLPSAITPLTVRAMALQADQPLNLNSTKPAVLRAQQFAMLERGGTVGAEAAEWLATRGLIDTENLSAAYNAVSFSAADKADANAANRLQGTHLRALLWQNLQDSQDEFRARWLNDFVNAGGVAALTGVRGALLEPYLYDINPTAETAWLAPNLFALAAAHDAGSKASAWYDTALATAETLPNAQNWLTRLWPLALALQLEQADLARLPTWVAIAQAQPQSERIPVADVLTVLEAAGFAIPAQIWAQVTDTPSAGAAGTVSQEQVQNLRAAAAANQQGAVILRANVLLQGGLKDAPTPAIAAVIRALADVELPDAAASLTIEALLQLLYPQMQ